MYPKQKFKVEIEDRLFKADERNFQQRLNAEALDKWILHSIIPQNNENGETEINILVFKKEE